MAIATGLKIYDTLTRENQEIFGSDGGQVRIYCCGPTVYRDAHIGNLRTFLLVDLVVRTLHFKNIKTLTVQNITDVGHMSEDFEEDKILQEAVRTNRDPFAIAREFEEKFHHDLALLNISKSDLYPRASESIDLMHQHMKKLEGLGLIYQGADGNVYFSSEKFPSYGALSGNKLQDLKPGHRYEFQEGGAKNFHADWALWKPAGSRREMVWNSNWGLGFPGWHIECSAMSLHFLQGHIDLHIGGIDLRFPHHENERAQSNPVVGDGEAVSAWLHGEHLLFEGRKMSKSAGNVILLKDVIEAGFDPLALRFCFLENRYRSQMDLSWASIKAADKVLRRWRDKYSEKPGLNEGATEFSSQFIADICQDFLEDLDTPRALLKLRALEKDSTISDSNKRWIFQGLEPLFGLDFQREVSDESPELSEYELELIQMRKKARDEKNFQESDRLRELLNQEGIEVRDLPTGQEWFRKQ
jgi:cysteinyl-tRNA synthetase